MANNQQQEGDDGFGSLKPVGFFRDRDFASTPCFRNSFLYSILAGFGVGIGQFMFTSNPFRASKSATFAFLGVLTPYYAYCRHKRVSDRFHFEQVRDQLENYVNRQGIDMDPDELINAALEAGLPPEVFLQELEEKQQIFQDIIEEQKKAKQENK